MGEGPEHWESTLGRYSWGYTPAGYMGSTLSCTFGLWDLGFGSLGSRVKDLLRPWGLGGVVMEEPKVIKLKGLWTRLYLRRTPPHTPPCISGIIGI